MIGKVWVKRVGGYNPGPRKKQLVKKVKESNPPWVCKMCEGTNPASGVRADVHRSAKDCVSILRFKLQDMTEQRDSLLARLNDPRIK